MRQRQGRLLWQLLLPCNQMHLQQREREMGLHLQQREMGCWGGGVHQPLLLQESHCLLLQRPLCPQCCCKLHWRKEERLRKQRHLQILLLPQLPQQLPQDQSVP